MICAGILLLIVFSWGMGTVVHVIGTVFSQIFGRVFTTNIGIPQWIGGAGLTASHFAFLAVICLTIFVLALASVLYDVVRARHERQSLSEEESELLREIWNGAQRMDDRLTNLEVIVMNEEKREEYERGF